MKRVLIVGNCDFDDSRLVPLIKEEFEVEVINVKTTSEAENLIDKEQFALIMVNRVGDIDGRMGTELVSYVKGRAPIMLITDLEDAMQESISLGAVQGFGKSMDDLEIVRHLKFFLG